MSITNPCANPITISFDPCLDIDLLKNSGFQNFARVSKSVEQWLQLDDNILVRLGFLMGSIKLQGSMMLCMTTLFKNMTHSSTLGTQSKTLDSGCQCNDIYYTHRYIVNKTAGKLILKFRVTPTIVANETRVITCSYQIAVHVKRLSKDSGSPNRVPHIFPFSRLHLC